MQAASMLRPARMAAGQLRPARPLMAPSTVLRSSAPVMLLRSTSNGSEPSSSTTTTTGNSDDECEYNVAGEYCSIDPAGKRQPKRTLGEMEQDFLQALTSWYYEGKPVMSDEEFSLLKEELIWSGSTVAVLTSDEQRFLEASMAYARGKPILSDEAYDALKVELRNKSSIVTAQGPRCSIRSKKMYADAEPDYLRMTLLNVPSVMLCLGLVFAVDYSTDFGLTSLIELPAPYGVVLLWGLVLPSLFTVAYALTQVGFKDNLIMKAQCPSCGAENFTYFGDIFTIAGNRGQNTMECGSCKADLTFDEYKRIVVVAETSEVKQEKLAAAAAKKAAAARKKTKAPAAASVEDA